MDSGAFDSLARSLGSRRRALAAGFGGTLSVLGLTAAEDANAGTKAKKKKKKKKQEAVRRYNACLIDAPSRICGVGGYGCPNRNYNADCANCYNSLETCCERELISSAARCACMNTTGYAKCTA